MAYHDRARMRTEPTMEDCITQCWECRHECQTALYTHCLEEGGVHLGTDHVKLMTDCIQICQTAADFMTRNSPMHAAICRACADICDACALSCDRIEDMETCADACRACSEACHDMAARSPVTFAEDDGEIHIHA